MSVVEYKNVIEVVYTYSGQYNITYFDNGTLSTATINLSSITFAVTPL